ncbi:hypothetical protein RLW55_16400 [Hyphomicrobium sp. B1]|uniref:hypothetical protein n=1 Tax=Hyphomicrobium sp. B1 TaxID=3075651 RepID=UPI003C2B46EB
MIKRAFLHIGGEKTGTTTLQNFLTRNAALLEKAGFYYPCGADEICFENNAHFPVAASVLTSAVEFVSVERYRTLSSVLPHLTQMCRIAEGTLILSCEHLSSRLDHLWQIRKLRDALPTDDIKIVFYAREPSELALASWSTGIRCGNNLRFDANRIVPQIRYFNHVQTLDLWAEVFGESNLIVREYGRTQLVGGDIRQDFCKQLGVEVTNPLLDDDRNISLDLQRLEVLRHINEGLPQFDQCADGWRRAQSIRREIIEFIPEGKPLVELLSRHDTNAIKARFSEVTRELNGRYFGGRLSRKWFSEDFPEEPIANSPATLQDAEVIRVLVDTITRIAEKMNQYETLIGVQRSRRISSRLKKRLRSLKQRLKYPLGAMKRRVLAPHRRASVPSTEAFGRGTLNRARSLTRDAE